MINPITRDSPLRKVKLLCFSKPPPFNACVGSIDCDVGPPRAVYPAPAVEESGNKFDAKSKVEDTVEWERPCRVPFAALLSASGSSSLNDSLRDEGAPEGDDSPDSRLEPCDEDAKEASSRESRGGWDEEWPPRWEYAIAMETPFLLVSKIGFVIYPSFSWYI